MTDPWKDWEDYNHGLQGTQTGSGYNEIGLRDRNKTANTKQPAKVKRANNKVNDKKAASNASKQVTEPVSKNELKWIRISFCVGAILGCLILYKEGVEEPFAYFMVGALAGGFFAKFYKVILGLSIGVAVFLLYVQIQNQ